MEIEVSGIENQSQYFNLHSYNLLTHSILGLASQLIDKLGWKYSLELAHLLPDV